MQKNNPTANIKQIETTSRFTKRIGSTVYKVEVYFNKDTKETMEDKLLRLIEREVERNA